MKRFVKKRKYLILLVLILGLGITGCKKNGGTDSTSFGNVTNE